jgi:amidophosphoribosyltransferase
VAASERPVIQTALNVPTKEVMELEAGSALIEKSGKVTIENIRGPFEKRSCSFERIYFSRGSDSDIYNERKMLGELLTPDIAKAVDDDLENTVFSFIPNTAETAFFGMINGIEKYMRENTRKQIIKRRKEISLDEFNYLIAIKPRIEKVAIKDIKLRTFITQDDSRNDLVGHVYDIAYDTVKRGIDNLVIIDDSIVRGTTLKYSIIKILDRLGPKRIVIVSSSPQIRYPDCYGIDMTRLGDFVAFRAAIDLLKETGQENIINDVYKKSKAQENLPKEEIVNYVKEIYKPFTAEQISDKISSMLRTKDIQADIRIVFQSIENLHTAIPNHFGDWYFTGNYPTPGGNKVVNRSYINFIEGRNTRSY